MRDEGQGRGSVIPEPVPRNIVRRAVLDALGMPSLVLLASMTGFGSLARESALGLEIALLATAGIWGLPGQIALAELYAAGSEILAVVMAVSLANARFLPMAVSFVPLLRPGLARRAWGQALVALKTPQWDEAEGQLAEGLRLLESGQAQLEAARTHVAWGAVCRDRGDLDAARTRWERAAAQWQASGLTHELERTRALLDGLASEQ